MLTYLGSRLSIEEYLFQRCNGDKGTGKSTRAAISNLSLFCKDQFDRDLSTVLRDLESESHTSGNLESTLQFLQKFVTWMSVPHENLLLAPNNLGYKAPCRAKDLETIKGYLIQARLVMRKVGGIPLDKDTLRDYNISFPPPQNKEPVRPLELEEFKVICDNQHNFRRQMLYRIKRGAEARIGAMVQLRKKNFDTTKRPMEIFFPRHIMKKKNGVSYDNIKYVLKEDEESLLRLLERFDDEDLVFGTNEDKYIAANNEDKAWRRLVITKDVNLGERYAHSGKLKVTIHTIKSMTFTAAVEAVNETYANSYGDHSRYTKNYLRWSDEQKIEKFRLLEPFISIYDTKLVKIHDSPKLIEENTMLKEQVEKLSSKIMASTSIPAPEDLEKIMEKLLLQHNII